ncbi:MAG: aminotransferase class V-fold PLP-dependent enzyme [Gemmatimonadales bacterium]|nr:aminotransferase class V-fold PLP-dependent enzyme [Gemmatimonadales bacterium]
MSGRQPLHPDTVAVRTQAHPEPGTGAVAPPIHLATTFERAGLGPSAGGYVYGREANPNRDALERALAELEAGTEAFAFASGLAAISAVFQALRPGDHVVAEQGMYYGARVLLDELYGAWGLRVTYADLTDLAAARAAITPGTRLVWAETPSNPMVGITDLAAVAEVAHAAGALLGVDNTWATPILQQPLVLGADIVMHATTKYLGGHSDVTGGALVVRERGAFAERLRLVQVKGGAVPSPFDAWLLLRGIRTLPVRVARHCDGAQAIAERFARHPALERVHWPGLADDPGYAVARHQMRRPGGMLSLTVKGGREGAVRVLDRVRLFTRATSLGGVESLIEHRASAEGPTTRSPEGLLRLSIGLEHPDDLVADLAQALGDD